ncbi:hypothetical protein H2203_006081 [Taxawa tesnikishii (nom. ined.)]|nr:hypothetical protein H2203_006081 [Dothideales sp. JES 119]
MSESRNVVILGASYAGLSAAHYFLKHVLPGLPKNGNYHIFLEIAPGFKKYPSNVFTFVQGKATAMDTNARTVTISRTHGGEEVLPYHALILATGTKTGAHEETQSALSEFHTEISKAKSIVVVGGGPAGVETAGEIGEFLNGAAGWFSSKPAHPKASIKLVVGGNKMLPILRESLSKQAEVLLNRVGVDVIYDAKMERTEKLADGRTKILLDNGKALEADVYVPAMGVVPMTEYVPKELLNAKGYVKTNAVTLRVDEAGPCVYTAGDVSSATRGGIMDMYEAMPVLMTNLKRDLLAAAKDPNGKPTGPDRTFKASTAESQLVPVGRSKGVGAFNGNKLPSIMVYMIKGRDYMNSAAVQVVTGSKWEKEKGWKPTDG